VEGGFLSRKMNCFQVWDICDWGGFLVLNVLYDDGFGVRRGAVVFMERRFDKGSEWASMDQWW